MVKKIAALMALSMIMAFAIPASALEYTFNKTITDSSQFEDAWTKTIKWTLSTGDTVGSGYYGYDTHLLNEDICNYGDVPDYYVAAIVVNGKGKTYDIQESMGYTGTMANVWVNHSGSRVRYRVGIGYPTDVQSFVTDTPSTV